jgi:hypothetical protein
MKVNTGLERKYKEIVMAYVCGGSEKNHEKPVRMMDVPTESQTGHLLSKN